MDYTFTEGQKIFRKSVRDFLRKECPTTLVRGIQEKKQDYSRPLYEKMARLGWNGLMIPEEYGGSGGDWIDMAIFYEEAGRALLQSPHYTTLALGASIILALGNEGQKKDLLPKIADGRTVLALALSEPDAGDNLQLMGTNASRKGDSFRINGLKLFVRNAHIADDIITVARTEGVGTTLFLVKRGSPGLKCTPMETIGGDTVDEVVYENVEVSQDMILGYPGGGAGVIEIVDKAKIARCAEMLGGTQAVLDMTLSYCKQRTAFGHPIGSYQTIKHKLADLALAIQATRCLVYYVAWLNSNGLPSAKETAMAQLEATKTYASVTFEAVHMHGAVALFRDHDLTLYYRKSKADQVQWAPCEDQKELIAASVFGQ